MSTDKQTLSVSSLDSDLTKQELLDDIEAYVERVWDDILADLSALVAIPSVADVASAATGAPFGPEARRALDCALDMAARLGLKPTCMDGYLGYADLEGERDTLLATIAHIDVVPAGQGWSQDPYQVVEKDGYLLGRGVVDDKGPAVLSAYMAHYFVEKGQVLPYTLRVMFGSDEECGMSDIEHYLAHYPSPAFLFTPDASFPACVGEKGIYKGSFTSPRLAQDSRIVSFDGGTASNAVAGLAELVLRCADVSELPVPTDDIDIEPVAAGCVRLVAHGKGGHASAPAGTKNAIGMLVDYLLATDVPTSSERSYFELLKCLFVATDGSALGIAASDDLFDPLTIIGGTIHVADECLVQTMDCRYPKSTSGSAITERLTSLADAHGASFTCDFDTVPFFVDPHNPAVCALIDAYNEFTGKDEKPFTMGGGTYARHFASAVSFGPEEIKEPVPDFVGSIHGPNEGMSIELLKRALKIYIYSLAKLMELDF